MLRVGIDARLAGRGLGIATALQGLTPALAGHCEVVWIGASATAPAEVSEVIEPPTPYPVFDLRPAARILKRARLDVLHFAGNTGWMKSGSIPTVLTIHDLIFLQTAFRRRTARQALGHRYLSFNVRRAARAAQQIVVPSAATAIALAREIPGHAPVTVVPFGVSAPPAQKPARRAGRPYLLAFAAPDPRKRLDIVIDAWRRLNADLNMELWVVEGAGLPPGYGKNLVKEMGPSGLRLLRYVPRDELWSIIAGALALVYPSEVEGFGFPVLEGLAAGTAVVTGLSPATTEVGGDAILLIDRASPVESIVRGVERLQSEVGLREHLARGGRRRAAKFTWVRTAEAYYACYLAAADERRHSGAPAPRDG